MGVNVNMPHQIGSPGELLPAKSAIKQLVGEGLLVWLWNGLLNAETVLILTARMGNAQVGESVVFCLKSEIWS